ncbi:unnamed protein product [Fusarium fujikuroi]|nr:unnamed protein product [Fusarium fujikuroi]
MDTLTHVLLLPEALETLGSPSVIIPRASSTSDEVVSYAHLTDLVQSLQQDLAALGISAGNKLALVLPNGLQYVTILLAAIRQRAISAPIHPNSTREECKQIFSLMVPDLVVVISSGSSTNGLQSAQAAVLAAQDLSLLVASCHAYPQSGRLSFRFALSRVTYEAGASKYPAPCAEYSRDDVMAEDKVLMLFTSGTTGRPKSVQLTHTNLLVATQKQVDAFSVQACDGPCLAHCSSRLHLVNLEASLKRKIDEVKKDKMELVKYEAEASGSSETDDKETFTHEIDRHKDMVQISEKVYKKALNAVTIERAQQNISDICATQESTALAGKSNVDGSDTTGQDITKVHAKHRSFAVAGVANNFDFASFARRR